MCQFKYTRHSCGHTLPKLEENDDPSFSNNPALACLRHSDQPAHPVACMRLEPLMLQQSPHTLPAAAGRFYNSSLQFALSRLLQNEGIRWNSCCSIVPLRQLLRHTLQLTRRHPPRRQRIHFNAYCTTIHLGLALMLKHNTPLWPNHATSTLGFDTFYITTLYI